MIRKIDPAPFIRKVAEFADEFGRSWPVALTASLRYGTGGVSKVGREALASRTDGVGNIQPYESDDPEVLRHLFGVETE